MRITSSRVETGRTLKRTLKVFLLFLCAGFMAYAQVPKSNDNPVAQVRDARSWEMGPIAYFGQGTGNRDQFRFFSAGFQVGKPLSPVVHAGILSGQFELAGNIQPFWQAYTPAAHMQPVIFENATYLVPLGGGTFTGFSITPVILRWNFLTRSRRIQPWFQGAGGLVYTTHKYPPDVLIPHGLPGGTS